MLCPECKKPDVKLKVAYHPHGKYMSFYALEIDCLDCGFSTTVEMKNCLERVLDLMEGELCQKSLVMMD